MADADFSATLVLEDGTPWPYVPGGSMEDDQLPSLVPWLSWLNCEVGVDTGTEGVSLGLFIEECPDDKRADYEAAIDAAQVGEIAQIARLIAEAFRMRREPADAGA